MNTHTILLVDDEENVTRALSRILICEPFEVLCASSGKQGLEILATTDVNVAISDEQMPHMDGPTFLSEVHRLYPHIIRMILTGQNSPEASLQALREGRSLHYRAEVFRFFSKPCRAEDLISGIHDALERQRTGARPLESA